MFGNGCELIRLILLSVCYYKVSDTRVIGNTYVLMCQERHVPFHGQDIDVAFVPGDMHLLTIVFEQQALMYWL